ncbi:MAG: hypothetical protein JSS07_10115 [Proteobacteria bacterium]|nr:hypothetical protein [Pseudomonadota bacterium]
MANSRLKPKLSAIQSLNFAKVSAYFAEDVSKAILGFIPNGLNLIYDFVLKSLPVVGKYFAHPWAEQVLKLCFGITLGRGLADDIAYHIFRPSGFAIGLFLGAMLQKKIAYHGQIGKLLFRLSGQTVGGALLILIVFTIGVRWIANIHLETKVYLLVTLIGALIGLMAKGVLILAINSVNAANVAVIRNNAKRAKELNGKLKLAAKQKAKSLILMQAQDIIQQMNGPQSQQFLESFFEQAFDNIAISTFQKIDRHFNYLTDRACHGDLKALNRMQDLGLHLTTAENKNALDNMVERIFNTRAILKLKDDVDTIYDRWQYAYLRNETVNQEYKGSHFPE